MTEDSEYLALAGLVRDNFELVVGAKTYACAAVSTTPAQVSNALNGKVRSWALLKALTRWYHRTYTNIGEWDEIFARFDRRFPDEGWKELARSVETNRRPFVKPETSRIDG